MVKAIQSEPPNRDYKIPAWKEMSTKRCVFGIPVFLFRNCANVFSKGPKSLQDLGHVILAKPGDIWSIV